MTQFVNRTIGQSADFHDWVYSRVCKNLFDADLPMHKLVSDGPLTSVLEAEFVSEVLRITETKKKTSTTSNTNTFFTATNEDETSYVQYQSYPISEGHETVVQFITADELKVQELKKYLDQSVDRIKENMIYVVSTNNGHLSLEALGQIKNPLERGNYEDGILEEFDYVTKEFQSEKPYGRLTVINGVPGTGKTHLVRGLVHELSRCLCILLPAKLLTDVDSPQLISLISQEKSDYGIFSEQKSSSILFVVEDADACLVTREGDNVMTISSLLNLTDGLLGEMLDLRVLATTNASHIEFDAALKRPGRMCKHIHVPPLPPEKASEVFQRITGVEKEYKRPVTLADVYGDTHEGFTRTEEKKKTLGFS